MKTALRVGATLFVAQYFLKTLGTPIEGDANLINGGIGIEYALSSNFEVVAETHMSVLSFSSDPSQVRFVTMGLSIGLGYLY